MLPSVPYKIFLMLLQQGRKVAKLLPVNYDFSISSCVYDDFKSLYGPVTRLPTKDNMTACT